MGGSIYKSFTTQACFLMLVTFPFKKQKGICVWGKDYCVRVAFLWENCFLTLLHKFRRLSGALEVKSTDTQHTLHVLQLDWPKLNTHTCTYLWTFTQNKTLTHTVAKAFCWQLDKHGVKTHKETHEQKVPKHPVDAKDAFAYTCSYCEVDFCLLFNGRPGHSRLDLKNG